LAAEAEAALDLQQEAAPLVQVLVVLLLTSVALVSVEAEAALDLQQEEAAPLVQVLVASLLTSVALASVEAEAALDLQQAEASLLQVAADFVQALVVVAEASLAAALGH